MDEAVLASPGGAVEYASHSPTMVARHRICAILVLGVSLHLSKLQPPSLHSLSNTLYSPFTSYQQYRYQSLASTANIDSPTTF